MLRHRSTLLLACLMVILVLRQDFVQAGPMKRPSRMVREVYPEIEPENEGNQAQVCIVGDVVYGMDETVPAEQPCLKCKCQAPGVQCETIQCIKRPGCKAVHKPNKCCPDYQCECEHNGKFYANGEKLETSPGGECKVCYCRGGEIKCAEVSCYIRKDCEGKRVPGTCCPKYDHCPPIDAMPTTEIILSNLNKEDVEPWPTNLTETSPISGDFQNENKIPDTNYFEATAPSVKQDDDLSGFQADAALLPSITIQEIIPERKEIPITAPPKTESEPQGVLIIEEAGTVNDLVTDVDVDSSEVSEILHQPPPVLRVGDKLLFLNKGDEFVQDNETSTPSSVITVVGAEGLQRGFEESAETTDTPANITQTVEPLQDNKDLDQILLNTDASTHVFSLVKRKDHTPETTTATIEDYITTIKAIEPSTEADLNATEDNQNPAYPPISEILTQDLDDTPQRFETSSATTETYTYSEPPETNSNSPKILPDVLEIRSNKTVPQNVSNSDWLKKNEEAFISLGGEFLSEETVNSTEGITTDRSVEEIETSSEDSGENVTRKPVKNAAIMSSESASIESNESSSEVNDMVQNKVTLIDKIDETGKNNTKINSDDVEIIDFNKMSTTPIPELLPQPEKLRIKRDADSDEDSSEEIFDELRKNLNEEQTESNVSSEEEEKESEAIFKELLEDSSTQKPESRKDGDILGLLSNYFNN